MIDPLMKDVLHGLRALRRAPILLAVVVLSLGVGIGVNTVVFSWIQALVLRPIPGVANASSIYLVEPRTETGLRPGASWLEYKDLQERLRSFPHLSAFRMPFNVGETSRSERTYGLLVSGNYFSSLGLQPARGRFFASDDASRPGVAPVVVLGYDYWQSRFEGDPLAIGRTLHVNDVALTIIGVTPDGFQGTVLSLQFDLWVPATMAPALLAGSRELEDRTLRGYSVLGRLPSSVPVAQAQAEVAEAMRGLAERYPDSNGTMQADLLQFWRALRGPQSMLLQGVTILQGVMLVLLLAVCSNTATLVLARALSRQREIGVRLAVGAGMGRIIRLLLVENLLLGLAGAAVGAAIAFWGTTALRAMPLATTQFPVRLQTSLDAGGLLFAVVLGILGAVAFGLAPALQLARIDPQAVLRAGSAMAPRSGLRRMVMAIEVAFALVVLIAAALFVKSFRETQDVDPGFRREGVLLAAYDLSGRGIDTAGARTFAARLQERLASLPDVEATAISSSIPLDIHGLPMRSFSLEGRARPNASTASAGPREAPDAADALDRVLTNVVTPGYFQTMGIPLLAGRDFADLRDTAAPPQAIVNDAFVRRYLESGESLGRGVQIGNTRYVIAGVVKTSLYESFSEPPTPIIYFSYRDRPSRQGEIHVRARRGDEAMLGPQVRRVVRDVDPALLVYNVRTLSQQIDTSLALRRIPARMFVVLGPLILVLAAIGIYAVVAFSVAHRTGEIGVRIALGATASQVVGQIVGESLRVVGAGALLGWLFAASVYTHLIRGGLDAFVFAGVPAVLLAVAMLACWMPARRAAHVDPAVSLRAE